MSKYKIGVDVGGTFTDFLLFKEGTFQIYKVPSTPWDPSEALLDGLEKMAEDLKISTEQFLKEVSIIVHGTTVATNAVLTLRGAKTALLTTKGFRDALQMRRGVREEIYNNQFVQPTPLVPRHLRLPVDERTNFRGEVVTPLDRKELQRCLAAFKKEGVEALAVCFMHSYANSANEETARQVIRQELPEVFLSLSSRLLPEIRFYNRVSTTVFDAYIGPILDKYLKALVTKLEAKGFQGVLLVMQSNGGVAFPEVIMGRPVFSLLSGPAGGPVAGVMYMTPLGAKDFITIDMGGTSFDVCLVKDGKPSVTVEGEIGRRRIAVPILAIHTVGAGGGSIIWHEGKFLKVGPQSAGANPGPACYGQGGEDPTVTDVDLILGYLNGDYFLGGEKKLNCDLAQKALHERICKPLGLDLIEAAIGAYKVVNVEMANAIRAVSIEKGYDPREFMLVVAGGAGPVHGAAIASELEIPLCVIPRESSVFCALGMLITDFIHSFARTYRKRLISLDWVQFRKLVAEMETEGAETLANERIAVDSMKYSYFVDLRYEGQYHEISVPVERSEIDEKDALSIAKRFHTLHDKMYGYSLEEIGTPVEVINLKVEAIGITEKLQFPELAWSRVELSKLKKEEREIYLPKQGWCKVKVYDGNSLIPGHKIMGPAIVEQSTTTILVLPEFDLLCEKRGNFLLYLKSFETKLKSIFGEGSGI